MRRAILAKRREALEQGSSEFRVGLDISQRRLPRGASHDRQWMSHAGVVGTENDYAIRDFQPRVHCRGDVARVDVSGMWCDAAESGDAAGTSRGGVLLNRSSKFLRTAGIELSSDSRRSYCGSHERPPLGDLYVAVA